MAETAVSTSMADSIRAAYKEVAEKEPVDDVAEPVEETPQAEPQESPEAAESTAAERARDKAGRFAPAETAADKQRETLKLKEKPVAAKEPERSPEKPAQQAVPAAQEPAKVAPPAHWNGSAKIDWNKIPSSLRESIAKDYEAVGKAQSLTAVLAPLEERFQREFGGTDRALSSILQYWQFARQDPLAFVKNFMQESRIDPQQLVSGVGNGLQPVQAIGQEQQGGPASDFQQWRQQVDTALQHIAQQPVIQAQNQIQSSIQQFQTALKPDGSVEHPYFNDVKTHMGALMSAPNGPTTLKEAYDQACWANPTVRASLMREQQAAQEAERKQAIARAQGAAVSVSGAPGVNGAQPLAAQSVSDTLRNVMRAAKGGRA
jgi:hypothetical protein